MADAKEAHTNRLMNEKSPYLLQHAHNPVDWYPWSEEVFARAREEDKPVFLSIGYSTCHWCHVMEEESFSDPDVAKTMNEHFVCVKVDREERPDIDKVYMNAIVAMTGRGGWPLTAFLTPEKKPFFGGTYFPPDDRLGMTGLKTILRSVSEAWANRREQVLRSGDSLVEFMRQHAEPPKGEVCPLGEGTLARAYAHFSENFDSRFGGFGLAPKFPTAHSLAFLLRYWKRTGESRALDMVGKTLEAMADGGIYDHLGGGFHRYSTDHEWHVPHFEKMLYDQAALSRVYLEAYQATGNSRHAETATEILDYVLRDMTGPGGGFHSAEDADSPPNAKEPERKREGAFYVWSTSEILDAVGEKDAAVFGYRFGVEAKGNVPNDPGGEFEGKNILHVAHTIQETAERFKMSASEIEAILERSKKTLYHVRSRRGRPHLDDKVLLDWNGLTISSLAFASRVLERPRYLSAAERAARFLSEHLVGDGGRLLHAYRGEEARFLGTIEDHAFFIHGLFELYEATFEVGYLEKAKRLAHEMLELFWDESAGGFFFTPVDREPLLVRQKELFDGAIPSGNSMGILDLLLVGRLTADRELEAKAESFFQAVPEGIARNPQSFTHALAALDFLLGGSKEIVMVGEKDSEATTRMLRAVYGRYVPNKVVVFVPGSGEERRRVTDLIQFVKTYNVTEYTTTSYLCDKYACKAPTTSPAHLGALLDGVASVKTREPGVTDADP